MLVVVVRYFGGVKLGVGGLIRAYRQSAKTTLEQGKMVTRYPEDLLELRFNYPEMNAVMQLISEFQGRIVGRDFGENCQIRFTVRRNTTAQIQRRLSLLPNLEAIIH